MHLMAVSGPREGSSMLIESLLLNLHRTQWEGSKKDVTVYKAGPNLNQHA